MTKPGSTKPGAGKAAASDGSSGPRAARREARSERLAAALKANLGRRKAQARERAADAAPVRDAERPGHEAGPAQNQVQQDQFQQDQVEQDQAPKIQVQRDQSQARQGQARTANES
jgi:hypothetical protein